MNNFRFNYQFCFLIISSLILFGCQNSTEIDSVAQNISNSIKKNDTTYLFVGMEWCQASSSNFLEIYSKKNIEKRVEQQSVVVFFSSKDYFENIVKKSNYSGIAYRIDSKGGIIDKYYANILLKKIIASYKIVDYVPIMLMVDSTGNYSKWHPKFYS